ncbi:hypothetical protein PF010_g4443 [Phytophthora fragariae]|uniref:Uncharacterized protein n=1 Tax=Phytophthora fragariae TaxID=53985 RepID=A0A6G0LRU0_9STRA|nr:hypothetical protein PF010_g4443 [Phytophthora fragariae]
MKMFWTLHEFMHMDILFELKIIAHKKPHVAKVHLKGAICNPAVAHRMALLLIEHGEQAALTENKQDDGRVPGCVSDVHTAHFEPPSGSSSVGAAGVSLLEVKPRCGTTKLLFDVHVWVETGTSKRQRNGLTAPSKSTCFERTLKLRGYDRPPRTQLLWQARYRRQPTSWRRSPCQQKIARARHQSLKIREWSQQSTSNSNPTEMDGSAPTSTVDLETVDAGASRSQEDGIVDLTAEESTCDICVEDQSPDELLGCHEGVPQCSVMMCAMCTQCSLEEHSRCPLCRNSAEAPPRDHAEQLDPQCQECDRPASSDDRAVGMRARTHTILDVFAQLVSTCEHVPLIVTIDEVNGAPCPSCYAADRLLELAPEIVQALAEEQGV